ncbi:MAG: NAD(P)-dependent oxidoreductase [Proteobacteria bacterium]|nr:NAD(P)-dependent oxidoreductase [Pseudomonadota bacterium]
MKILITGGNGFLGKQCAKLLENQSHEIISVDREGQVTLLGDLSNSHFTASLPDVDTVIHCAAVQYVTKNLPLFFREGYFRKNNVAATKNLCDRYRGTATHFINVGTSMMYRQTGQAVYSTDSQIAGEGVYSKSKVNAQVYVDNLLGSATVIPCIIGGKGREGLFRGFVTMMKRYGVVLYPGHGLHKIHMIHVEDVASLILAIAECRASGYFNAAAPEPLSISEWVDQIQDVLKIPRIIKLSLPLQPIWALSALLGYRLLAREQLLMLKYQHVLDIERSVRIGWQPKYTNAEIVRDIAIHINRDL